MDQNQEKESEILSADVEMATAATETPEPAVDPFVNAIQRIGHHHEPSLSNGDQAAGFEEPESDLTRTIDIANKATDLLPAQQDPEMAPPASAPAKRGRGRPRKHQLPTPKTDDSAKGPSVAFDLEESLSIETPPSKKPRGRPPKGKVNQSPSIVSTPVPKADNGSAMDLEARPLSSARRSLRLPTSTGMDSEEDNMSVTSSFSPINGRRRATTTFGKQLDNGDAFGPELKSKLRQALFVNAMEYDGGVHIPRTWPRAYTSTWALVCRYPEASSLSKRNLPRRYVIFFSEQSITLT
ncbi:hypothetical protein PG994_014746 [Apiospora phragmitis]|uniref:Uncharacterized protein n=1 Tax=Apiospora phragmitis TaxID=2905665 RepID=A0ABR1SUI3_9PEZI